MFLLKGRYINYSIKERWYILDDPRIHDYIIDCRNGFQWIIKHSLLTTKRTTVVIPLISRVISSWVCSYHITENPLWARLSFYIILETERRYNYYTNNVLRYIYANILLISMCNKHHQENVSIHESFKCKNRFNYHAQSKMYLIFQTLKILYSLAIFSINSIKLLIRFNNYVLWDLYITREKVF